MFMKRKRAAFQILLAKARELSMRSSVRTMSVPGAAPCSSAMRTASVPYFSVTTSGSITLPLRLRHLLALGVAHQAVDVDLAEGHSPMNSMPSMTMRATQKNRMSKPVMSSEVG